MPITASAPNRSPDINTSETPSSVASVIAISDNPKWFKGMKSPNPEGARTHLRQEGILVLGHQDQDPMVAAALGLPVPQKGEFISARVLPAREGRADPVAVIGGQLWALARPGDPMHPAPDMPRRHGR